MNWPATSSRATGRGAGRASQDPSAATLLLLREADATMSPSERNDYVGLASPPPGPPHAPSAEQQVIH